MTLQHIPHGKVRLALHTIRQAEGPKLLLLHGLGEHAGSVMPPALEHWRGSVYALDFTGHGASDIPAGGGYTVEALVADVDQALAQLGPCTVVGRGLGAYVGLLIAGGRSELVRGLIMLDGPGLAGGGADVMSPYFDSPKPASSTPDPFALAELSRDPRPVAYAKLFAVLANTHSGLEQPLSVCCAQRPQWLRGLLEHNLATETSLAHALMQYP